MEGKGMSDIIDQANDTADTFLRSALSRRESEAPPANGRCLFCFSQLEPGHRWCDNDCREDWEKEQWAKRNAAIPDDE